MYIYIVGLDRFVDQALLILSQFSRSLAEEFESCGLTSLPVTIPDGPLRVVKASLFAFVASSEISYSY